MKSDRRNRGFTLVEMVCVLLIVGIITTVSGMAIVTAMQGYLFARDNASIGQRAQLALARINRELIEMTTVMTAESSRITYQQMDGNIVVSKTIYKDDTDNTIKIAAGTSAENGDILVDHVAAFEVIFYKEALESPWGALWISGTDPVKDLTVVEISIDITRTDENRDISFSTMVYPRNIKRY